MDVPEDLCLARLRQMRALLYTLRQSQPAQHQAERRASKHAGELGSFPPYTGELRSLLPQAWQPWQAPPPQPEGARPQQRWPPEQPSRREGRQPQRELLPGRQQANGGPAAWPREQQPQPARPLERQQEPLLLEEAPLLRTPGQRQDELPQVAREDRWERELKRDEPREKHEQVQRQQQQQPSQQQQQQQPQQQQQQEQQRQKPENQQQQQQQRPQQHQGFMESQTHAWTEPTLISELPNALTRESVAAVYYISGFATKVLNGAYKIDGDLTIGGKPTYWTDGCKLFMYYQAAKGTWQISPRWDASTSVDLLADARRGGSKGFAMQIRDTVWREFVDGQWLLADLRVSISKDASEAAMPEVARPLDPAGHGDDGIPPAGEQAKPNGTMNAAEVGGPVSARQPAASPDSSPSTPEKPVDPPKLPEEVTGSNLRSGDPHAEAAATKAEGGTSAPAATTAEQPKPGNWSDRKGRGEEDPTAVKVPSGAAACPAEGRAASDDDAEDGEEAQGQILQSVDLKGIVRYIEERKVTRMVVLCGAGISTSAGIPDFRSPGSGLYHNLQRFNLPYAEAAFELDYFRRHPTPFYELCKEIWPGKYEPTPAHYFIRLLHEKGMLLRCYSQNIDSLEGCAGLPPDRLVAMHGNFEEAHVIDKRPEVKVDPAELKEALDGGNQALRTLRQKYAGLVKPKIVFYGEQVAQRFQELHQEDLRQCELLLVMGTSLTVEPMASLVGKVRPDVPRLLINYERVGHHKELEGGFRFDAAPGGAPRRDVWFCGDCDGGVRRLAERLGWAPELEVLLEARAAGRPEAALDGGAAAGEAGGRGEGSPDREEPPKRQRTR